MINRIGLWAAAVSTGAFAFSAAALAADIPARMPVKAPPPVVVAVYNWTGLYIGIQGGYAWGDTEHEQSGIPASTGDFRIKGGLVGGTVGYNYQVNSIVFGIEADYSWSGIKGNAGPFVVGTYGCGLGPQRVRDRGGALRHRARPPRRGCQSIPDLRIGRLGLWACECLHRWSWLSPPASAARQTAAAGQPAAAWNTASRRTCRQSSNIFASISEN